MGMLYAPNSADLEIKPDESQCASSDYVFCIRCERGLNDPLDSFSLTLRDLARLWQNQAHG